MIKKGISLVEVVVVVAILLVLIAAAIGGIDPIGIFNKARDAQRKKDLNRIRIAFEDYYNDKDCYPVQELVTQLNLKTSCGTDVFSPWLKSWPCDPDGQPYYIYVGYDDDCPKWFKILTSLENKNDPEIPADWALNGNLWIGTSDVNYGISSSNISIFDIMGTKDPYCLNLGNCYYYPEVNKCNKTTSGCSGANCYIGECSERCHVECCGAGCN